MSYNINLYFSVILRNTDTHLNIEYYHDSDTLYINAYNENNKSVSLDDGLRSLNFSNDEIQKINHFLKYKTVDLSKTSIQPSDSDYKRENLKFFAELLHSNQRNLTIITDIIFEVLDKSTNKDTKVELTIDTDYSCITNNNVKVEVNESIAIKDPNSNKILHTRHFSDVNPKNMDIIPENNLFEKIFEGINARTIMYPMAHKKATYYLDQANIELKHMYLVSVNNKALKRLQKIKEKILSHISLTKEEVKLAHIKTNFYTPYPDRLNPDIYDVVKAYPILKPKPIPKYITKFTALRILNKIIDNVVSNKL